MTDIATSQPNQDEVSSVFRQSARVGRMVPSGAPVPGSDVLEDLIAPSNAALPMGPRMARYAAGYKLAGSEPGAIEDCYRILGPLVRGYLARLIASSDIDDVTQRVFLELWRCRDRYDPTRSIATWVLRIAHHRAVDHLRKRADVLMPLNWADELAGDDGRVFAAELAWASELRQLLAELPSEQRAPIQLAYIDGYTQSEIAALLHVPLGTVKSRTARALKNLARSLERIDSQASEDPEHDYGERGPRVA